MFNVNKMQRKFSHIAWNVLIEGDYGNDGL
jgi:hypothetical protein